MGHKHITNATNVIVPALLTLESLGFVVERTPGGLARATRGEETYTADDPILLLGLIKLIEVRTWDWRATDAQIDDVMKRYDL